MFRNDNNQAVDGDKIIPERDQQTCLSLIGIILLLWSLTWLLNPCLIHILDVSAKAAEHRKHSKCAEFSWRCIQLVVESYGAWEPEALSAISHKWLLD